MRLPCRAIVANPKPRFTGVLAASGRGGGHWVEVPFDAEQAFGEARPPVRGTVNGTAFRSRLAVYGGTTYLGFTRAIRSAAGIEVGDTVKVVMERDDAPRVVDVPEPLARALARDKTASGGVRPARVHAPQGVRTMDRRSEARRAHASGGWPRRSRCCATGSPTPDDDYDSRGISRSRTRNVSSVACQGTVNCDVSSISSKWSRTSSTVNGVSFFR